MITPNHLYDLFGYYEENRTFNTNGQFLVTCAHYAYQSYANDDSTTYKANQKPVRLNKFKYEGNKIGYAGKCEVCGKVYYTE
ncbi:hypothetical protein ACFQ3W_23435 [Paenibacillus puldeungensis]|uniref:Uncharacterized protein n=1 Tax=Paenibacillus puldeungensis TaxID=696536 RepID=A0ABW3S363_9BACL